MGSNEWVWITFILIASITVAVVVVIKAIAKQSTRRTADRLQALELLNLQFTTDIPEEVCKGFDPVLKIRSLQGQKKTSLAYGLYRDRQVSLLNLESIVYTGNAAVTILQSVCIMPLDSETPEMTISPRNLFHSLGKLFGSDAPLFASHPRFAEKYTVKGDDPVAIENFMTPGSLEFLEDQPGIFWAFSHNSLLYFQQSKEWYSHDEIRAFLDHGVNLVNGLQKP